jgi:Ser/Thr protein kinase RdoA (MazF antagonist)
MSAVDAAVAVAHAHDVHCERPIVLREAWHVLVHLWPSPVVARVTSGADGVDPDDVERELAVARHAARAGAPVVRPSDLLPPGPHRHDGHTVVFWRYLVRAGEVDATAAGQGLDAIHDSLADYDGELPRAGRAQEVRAMLRPLPPSDDIELLRELASRTLPDGQALHGDAHLHNCIQTSRGPIWHDLETACRGPREYDLAALLLSDRSGDADPHARIAIAGYGDYDEEVLEQALPVYGAWIAASFMVAVARRPDAGPALEREMQFLRRFRS